MDTVQENTLRRNQVQLVDDLDPKDILDDLMDEGVFTENDYERVNSGKSRKERCRILLAMLPTRGPSAYGSFQRALKRNSYPHLEALLHFNRLSDVENRSLYASNGSLSDELDQVNVCSKCEPYFPTVFSDQKLSVALKKNCCLLLANIEPFDILDWHYQGFILGRDECDRIRSEKTRRDRFVTFLKEISKCKSNNILPVFKLSLQKKYRFIVEKLDINLPESVPEDIDGKVVAPVQHTVATESPVQKTIECVTRDQEDVISQSYRESVIHESKIQSNDISLSFNIETVHDLLKDNLLPLLKKSTFEQEHTENVEESVEQISFRNFDSPYLSQNRQSTISASPSELKHKCVSPVSFCDSEISQSDEQRLAVSQVESACMLKHNLQPKSNSMQQTNKIMSAQKDEVTDPEEEDEFSAKVLHQQQTASENHEHNRIENCTVDNSEQKPRDTREYALSLKPGSLIPGKIPNRRLEVAFNLLSTMINQGQYDRFEQYSAGLKSKYHRNADMMCILGYLHASKDLFKTNFTSAKKHINTAMELVPKTSNPKYFTLELFTALTRMYITQKKFPKLQRALADAKMIIETDPVGCTGRAAGWLYMNDARNTTALLGLLNVHKPNFTKTYRNLHAQAKHSFQLSLANFQRDGGKDGPFGFGYALCRLVILLLQCGDSGLTLDVLHPSSDDIELAGNYLRHLEDSNIPILKILEVHYLLAKCDYQYRRNNTVRALEHAEAAHRLATDINMLEFTEHAHNRVLFLRTKTPLIIETVDEEEAARILFEESAESSQ